VRTFIGMAVLAVLLISPTMAPAQQPVSRTEEITESFTIEAIDHSARVVTLRNKAGLLEEVYCGPEVQRFDALKVGDTVTFRYYDTVVTGLSKPGAGAASSTTVTRTPGAPGGSIARETAATFTIETVDPKAAEVTVRTAAGGRSVFKVQDVKNLEGYKAGDQVTITYTRGLAISVTPPQAAEPRPSMEVYGFAMLDIGHDFKQVDPDWFDTLRATKLPSFEDQFGEDNRNFAGVRQSRLGVRTSSPTAMGELKTTFEFELMGTGDDTGQTTFRLRHAYGELGAFGAGQYWSPFMDIDIFPNTIEYWGPTGMALFRNVHVRWMPVRGTNSQLTLALERPGASNDTGRLTNRVELEGVTARFPLPDFSGHYRRIGDWGHAQVAGIVRKFNWDDNNDDQFDLSGSEMGWGINLTSALKVTDGDTLKLGLVYGAGIQNYMNDSPVDAGIVRQPGNALTPVTAEAIPLLGITAFVDHAWSSRWSSSVGYSMQDNDNREGSNPDAFRKGHYAVGNLLFTPVPNVMAGGELQWARRENYLDGFTSDGLKIQFSFKYNFSARIGGN
jgi:Cu/Ag efflux protein CusF